jgi:HK97 gp10 family phage protein
MKMKIKGLRECEAALTQLPKATGKNVLRRVGRNRLEPMREHAAAKAPDDPNTTGGRDLSSSIKIRNAKAKVRFVQGKFRADSSRGISLTMGPSKAAFHGKFQEWGTIHHAAQPFMRPAWDAGARKVVEGIRDDLWNEIQRAAARLANKKAKQGK